MRIAVPKETREGERRVALVPESCKKLIGKGIQVAADERILGTATSWSGSARRGRDRSGSRCG